MSLSIIKSSFSKKSYFLTLKAHKQNKITAIVIQIIKKLRPILIAKFSVI